MTDHGNTKQTCIRSDFTILYVSQAVSSVVGILGFVLGVGYISNRKKQSGLLTGRKMSNRPNF